MARQALAKALEEGTRLEKAAADQATKFEEQESNLHAALQAGRLREAEKATFEAALEHSQGTVVELQQNLAERDAALEAMQGKLVMAQALIAEEARKASDAEDSTADYRARLKALVQASTEQLTAPITIVSSPSSSSSSLGVEHTPNPTSPGSDVHLSPSRLSPIPTMESLTPKSSAKTDVMGKTDGKSRLVVTRSPLGHAFGESPTRQRTAKKNKVQSQLGTTNKVLVAGAALSSLVLTSVLANKHLKSADPLPTEVVLYSAVPIAFVFILISMLMYTK